MSNNPNRYMGNSKRKFQNQLNQYPSEKQIKVYNLLRKKCAKNKIAVRLKKPITRLEYSEAIDYLDNVLRENSQQKSVAPIRLYEKDTLLSLFDKMTAKQQTSLIKYAEVLLRKQTNNRETI